VNGFIFVSDHYFQKITRNF